MSGVVVAAAAMSREERTQWCRAVWPDASEADWDAWTDGWFERGGDPGPDVEAEFFLPRFVVFWSDGASIYQVVPAMYKAFAESGRGGISAVIRIIGVGRRVGDATVTPLWPPMLDPQPWQDVYQALQERAHLQDILTPPWVPPARDAWVDRFFAQGWAISDGGDSTAPAYQDASRTYEDHVQAFLDFARHGDREGFVTLAGALGIDPAQHEEMWTGTVRRVAGGKKKKRGVR